MGLRLIAAAAVLALAGAAPAAADDLRVEGTTIVFTGSPGNDMVTFDAYDGTGVGFGLPEDTPVTVEAPCVLDHPGYAYCPAAGMTGARLEGGAGGDELLTGNEAATPVPLEIDGGDGDDLITGAAGAETLDGGAGDDQIAGAAGDDKVLGGAGDDDLSGNAGDDAIVGGPGADVFSGGSGDDTVDLRDGAPDRPGGACDEGDDTVLTDPSDKVAEYTSSSGANMVEASCEHLPGTAAPKPMRVFTVGRVGRSGVATFDVDVVDAFRGTYTARVTLAASIAHKLHLKPLLATATVAHTAFRTTVKVRIGRRLGRLLQHGRALPVTIRLTDVDTAGRTGTSTWKRSLWGKP